MRVSLGEFREPRIGHSGDAAPVLYTPDCNVGIVSNTSEKINFENPPVVYFRKNLKASFESSRLNFRTVNRLRMPGRSPNFWCYRRTGRSTSGICTTSSVLREFCYRSACSTSLFQTRQYQKHLESPQFRQVRHPSNMITVLT